MKRLCKYLVVVLMVGSFVYACAKQSVFDFGDAKAALQAAEDNGAEQCASLEYAAAQKAFAEAEILMKESYVCSPNPIAKTTAGGALDHVPCISPVEYNETLKEKLLYAESKAKYANNKAIIAREGCNIVKSKLSEVEDEISLIRDDLIESDGVYYLNKMLSKYNEVAGYIDGCRCDDANIAFGELLAFLGDSKSKLAASEAKSFVGEQKCSAEKYTVVKGDSLWKISESAYLNPFMWPLIYWANKSVIVKDPDLIYPGQMLSINDEGCYDESETNRSVDFSKHRGPWSLFDGK